MAKRFKNLQEALKSPDAVTSVAVDLEQDEPAQNSARLSRLVTFPNLKELIISAAVCEVPESLGQLRGVEWLRIELLDCGDDPLPSTLGMLTALRSLEIERSEIAKIPATIGELVNLRSLSLRQTSIRELPSSISGCKDLEELDCTECHDLAVIPKEVGGPPTNLPNKSPQRGCVGLRAQSLRAQSLTDLVRQGTVASLATSCLLYR